VRIQVSVRVWVPPNHRRSSARMVRVYIQMKRHSADGDETAGHSGKAPNVIARGVADLEVSSGSL
jgi:hypothetical protein